MLEDPGSGTFIRIRKFVNGDSAVDNGGGRSHSRSRSPHNANRSVRFASIHEATEVADLLNNRHHRQGLFDERIGDSHAQDDSLLVDPRIEGEDREVSRRHKALLSLNNFNATNHAANNDSDISLSPFRVLNGTPSAHSRAGTLFADVPTPIFSPSEQQPSQQQPQQQPPQEQLMRQQHQSDYDFLVRPHLIGHPHNAASVEQHQHDNKLFAQYGAPSMRMTANTQQFVTTTTASEFQQLEQHFDRLSATIHTHSPARDAHATANTSVTTGSSSNKYEDQLRAFEEATATAQLELIRLHASLAKAVDDMDQLSSKQFSGTSQLDALAHTNDARQSGGNNTSAAASGRLDMSSIDIDTVVNNRLREIQHNALGSALNQQAATWSSQHANMILKVRSIQSPQLQLEEDEGITPISQLSAMKLLLAIQQWMVMDWVKLAAHWHTHHSYFSSPDKHSHTRSRQTHVHKQTLKHVLSQHQHQHQHSESELLDVDTYTYAKGHSAALRVYNRLTYDLPTNTHDADTHTADTHTMEHWLRSKIHAISRTQATAELFRLWANFAGVGTNAHTHYTHMLLRTGFATFRRTCARWRTHRIRLMESLGERLEECWPQSLVRKQRRRSNSSAHTQQPHQPLFHNRVRTDSKSPVRRHRYDDIDNSTDQQAQTHNTPRSHTQTHVSSSYQSPLNSRHTHQLTLTPFTVRGKAYFAQYLAKLGADAERSVRMHHHNHHIGHEDGYDEDEEEGVDYPDESELFLQSLAARHPHTHSHTQSNTQRQAPTHTKQAKQAKQSKSDVLPVGIFSPPPWTRTSLLGSNHSTITRLARLYASHRGPKLKHVSPSSSLHTDTHADTHTSRTNNNINNDSPWKRVIFTTMPTLQETALIELQLVVSLAFAFRRFVYRLHTLPRVRRLRTHIRHRSLHTHWQHWRSELHRVRTLERDLGVRIVDVAAQLLRYRLLHALTRLRTNILKRKQERVALYALSVRMRALGSVCVHAVQRFRCLVFVKCFEAWKVFAHTHGGLSVAVRTRVDSHCTHRYRARYWNKWKRRLVCLQTERASVNVSASVSVSEPVSVSMSMSAHTHNRRHLRHNRDDRVCAREQFHTDCQQITHTHALYRGLWAFMCLLRNRTRVYFSDGDFRYSLLPLTPTHIQTHIQTHTSQTHTSQTHTSQAHTYTLPYALTQSEQRELVAHRLATLRLRRQCSTLVRRTHTEADHTHWTALRTHFRTAAHTQQSHTQQTYTHDVDAQKKRLLVCVRPFLRVENRLCVLDEQLLLQMQVLPKDYWKSVIHLNTQGNVYVYVGWLVGWFVCVCVCGYVVCVCVCVCV
jgi:hypothetical protein